MFIVFPLLFKRFLINVGPRRDPRGRSPRGKVFDKVGRNFSSQQYLLWRQVEKDGYCNCLKKLPHQIYSKMPVGNFITDLQFSNFSINLELFNFKSYYSEDELFELFELFDGSVVSKIIVTITNSDSFVNDFEVEYKESTTSSFRLMRRGSNKIVEKYPVKEGTIYDIRCRAINSIGAKSAFTTTQHEVNSAFTPPDDVQNYSIDVVGDKLYHTFDAVTNLDLDFYEIRFTSNTNDTREETLESIK